MFNQIFVPYLVKKNTITPEQAEEILEVQKTTRVRIGTLAIEENLMTPQQVDFVNNLQSSKNMRFGDIAIDKGYLTKEQLGSLLSRQPREHIVLKQLLSDMDHIGPQQFERDLNNFKFSLGLDDKEFERLLDGDIGAYISHIAEISGNDVIMQEYAKIFVATTMRIIDREVQVKKSFEAKLDSSYKFVAAQGAVGDANVTFMFAAADEESAKNFAEIFAKDKFTSFNEDAQDSLKEFLNCIDGILITEFSNAGKMELDIEVPEFHETLSVENDAVVLPFSLSTGDYFVFIKK